MSKQNIVDRKNVIIKRKYLTETELDNIKREIGYELQLQAMYQQNQQLDAADAALDVE